MRCRQCQLGISRVMSAKAAASSTLLRQDHRRIYRAAMLKALGAQPEIVLVRPACHNHLSIGLQK